ncbi:MAG: polysaccharide deacetylase family protein [Nannocystaceae bacterium]
MRIALTADDAPSIQGTASGPVADAGRMDRIRDILQRRGIPHCVAFVIGETALHNEGPLRRWLEAGYELGNHTYRHLAASGSTTTEFMADVESCDRVLQDLGVPNNSRRWFRFPYLDRGPDRAGRRAIVDGLESLGYVVAHASADLHDHCYEGPLERARCSDDTARARAIDARYQAAALASLVQARQLTLGAFGGSITHSTYFHFGEASCRSLPQILNCLETMGVQWSRLDAAHDQVSYRAFDRDLGRSGLLTGSLPATLFVKIARRLARATVRLGLFEQGELGPKWPHLAE